MSGHQTFMNLDPRQGSFSYHQINLEGFDGGGWVYEFRQNKKGQITGATISLDRAERVPFKKIN